MTSDTLFRNVDFDPSSAVETWPTEALATAIERGSLAHWTRIAASIDRDPWGPVARAVEEVLACSHPYGIAQGLLDVVAAARTAREATERRQVAAELASELQRTGLSRAEFASRLGTSPSRLSTYLSGKVVPAATVLVRARALD